MRNFCLPFLLALAVLIFPGVVHAHHGSAVRLLALGGIGAAQAVSPGCSSAANYLTTQQLLAEQAQLLAKQQSAAQPQYVAARALSLRARIRLARRVALTVPVPVPQPVAPVAPPAIIVQQQPLFSLGIGRVFRFRLR